MRVITPFARLRKKRGFTQVDVAEEIGICRRTLSDYENGKREPPRCVVVELDDFYRCGGALIQYWLDKGKKKTTCADTQAVGGPKGSL